MILLRVSRNPLSERDIVLYCECHFREIAACNMISTGLPNLHHDQEWRQYLSNRSQYMQDKREGNHVQ